MTSDSASRATRSRREALLVALAVGGVLGGTRLLSAQEAPPAPSTSPPATAPAATPAATPAAAPAATPAATTPTPAATPTPPDDDAAAEAKPPPKAVGATPGRFEPTEKVRADFDVSFPIDI